MRGAAGRQRRRSRRRTHCAAAPPERGHLRPAQHRRCPGRLRAPGPRPGVHADPARRPDSPGGRGPASHQEREPPLRAFHLARAGERQDGGRRARADVPLPCPALRATPVDRAPGRRGALPGSGRARDRLAPAGGGRGEPARPLRCCGRARPVVPLACGVPPAGELEAGPLPAPVRGRDVAARRGQLRPGERLHPPRACVRPRRRALCLLRAGGRVGAVRLLPAGRRLASLPQEGARHGGLPRAPVAPRHALGRSRERRQRVRAADA